jgi:hypothetical protein
MKAACGETPPPTGIPATNEGGLPWISPGFGANNTERPYFSKNIHVIFFYFQNVVSLFVNNITQKAQDYLNILVHLNYTFENVQNLQV